MANQNLPAATPTTGRVGNFASNVYMVSMETAGKLHNLLLLFILIELGVLALMCVLNLIGLEEANLFIYFVGFIVHVSIATMPEVLLSLLGIVVLTKAEFESTFGLYFKMVKAVMMGFMIAAGFLATWSFQGEPGAMLWVIVGSMTVGWAQFVWDVSGKWFYWVITIYSIGIVLIGLGNTLDGEVTSLKGFLTSLTSEETMLVARPRFVTAPQCNSANTSLSEYVYTTAHSQVSWQATVEAYSLQDGEWVKLAPLANVVGEALRFCSTSKEKEVALTWQ